MDEEIKGKIVQLLGDNKIAESNDLLLPNAPKFLYKYRAGIRINKNTGELYDIEAINQNKLWMAVATELDDPYDCSVLIREDTEAIMQSALQIGSEFRDAKYIDALKNINQEVRETTLVCSLSEGYDDIDMWTRYANSGKGFCIKYDFNELFNKGPAFPVIYGDITKSIMEFRNKQKVYIDILLKKTNKLNWKTQKEWRIIKNATSNAKIEHGTLIEAPKPLAIYLGYNIHKEKALENKLKIFAKTNGIDIYEMILDSKEVRIIPQTIFL